MLQVTAVKFQANYSKVFVHIKCSKNDQDKKNVSLSIDKTGGIKRLLFIWKFFYFFFGGGENPLTFIRYQFSPLLERKKKTV